MPNGTATDDPGRRGLPSVADPSPVDRRTVPSRGSGLRGSFLYKGGNREQTCRESRGSRRPGDRDSLLTPVSSRRLELLRVASKPRLPGIRGRRGTSLPGPTKRDGHGTTRPTPSVPSGGRGSYCGRDPPGRRRRRRKANGPSEYQFTRQLFWQFGTCWEVNDYLFGVLLSRDAPLLRRTRPDPVHVESAPASWNTSTSKLKVPETLCVTDLLPHT